jgi:hypothetical protein
MMAKRTKLEVLTDRVDEIEQIIALKQNRHRISPELCGI